MTTEQPRMGMSTKEAMRRVTKVIQDRKAKKAAAAAAAQPKKETDK